MNFILKGLLNLRGGDLEYSPFFFSYLFITDNEMYLYLLNKSRAEDEVKISNHFQTEHIDIDIEEYNDTLTGLFNIVSSSKITSNPIDFGNIFSIFFSSLYVNEPIATEYKEKSVVMVGESSNSRGGPS